MVLALVKDAVRIKCGFESAVMTGNYECAYSLGIITAAAGLDKIEEYDSIGELRDRVLNLTKDFEPKDNNLKRILQMLREYEAGDSFNEQMKELYSVGFADETV